MKLLLVEDEPRMADALKELLRQEGYDVDCFFRGDDGLAALCSGQYDGVILDVMLPGLSGTEVAARSRRAGVRTPILMLTARGELDDKVLGLDAGADDYVTKPFQPRELLARVRALCRRGMPLVDDRLCVGDLALDVKALTLHCTATGQSVHLSEKECRVLEYLIANQRQILSREQLAMKIWGYEDEAEYNKVEVYISFARKKLAFVGSRVEIKAVRGAGYELRWDCG
ncbi:MAG: response regulator transcription factor [Clostridiales bacterium]|nr:response regulator transcription factor [Clostridiales bacterium]MCD8161270.1 response regulator transcription factor [Clostridiales bacterium]